MRARAGECVRLDTSAELSCFSVGRRAPHLVATMVNTDQLGPGDMAARLQREVDDRGLALPARLDDASGGGNVQHPDVGRKNASALIDREVEGDHMASDRE